MDRSSRGVWWSGLVEWDWWRGLVEGTRVGVSWRGQVEGSSRVVWWTGTGGGV